MEGQEFADLVASIKVNGLREPIVLFEDMILDGRNRARACELAGVEPSFTPFREDDPTSFVIDKNLHRRHLTAEQKRDIIATLLKADPTKSDRAIAKVVKADNKTVAAVRAKKERREEIPRVKTRTDTKGREQPAKKQKAAEASAKVEPNVPVAPTATPAKSWKVEVIAKDGKRYGNGVRFRTEEEADAYRANASLDLLTEVAVIVTATEVIPCDDAPSGAFMMRGERGRLKGRFTGRMLFAHGTCGTFDWEEIATIEQAVANPLVEAWDKTGPKQRHDFVLARKTEIMRAQQQIGKPAFDRAEASSQQHDRDDGLDLPASLRALPSRSAP